MSVSPEPSGKVRVGRDRRLAVVLVALLVVSLAWVVPRLFLSGEDRRDAGPDTTSTAPSTVPFETGPPVLGDAPGPGEVDEDAAPARLDPVPAPGTVTAVPGDFGAQVQLDALELRSEPSPVATGEVRYTANDSVLREVLVGIRVDFYDAQGARVGDGAQELRLPATVATADGEDGRRRPLPFAVGPRAAGSGAVTVRVAVVEVVVR